MAFILGVDGGKSKTVCLVADSGGNLLGWGRGGSSDQYDVSPQQAVEEITGAVHAALDCAGLRPAQVECGCFGLAGADWPEDFEALTAALAARQLCQRVLVKNDAQVALRACSTSGVGVALCAGTHLAAAIRTPGGEEWFSGWYSVQGAGGVEAGRRVLWAVLQQEDGRGEATALTGLALAHFQAAHPLDLLRRVSENRLGDSELAGLAPLLFRAHTEFADPVAAQIIVELGGDISRWAIGLMRRYHLLQVEFPVFLTGGLFKGAGSLLQEVVAMEIHRQAPRACVSLAQREPVFGALFYACESLGMRPTPEWLENLDRRAPGEALFDTANPLD